MRYRPFGGSGAAVSNITLSLGAEALGRGPERLKALIFAALEAGVNSYLLESADPVLAEVVGEGLSPIERQLLTVSLVLGSGDGRGRGTRDFSAEGMRAAIEQVLHISSLGWIDVAVLDQPGENELTQPALKALKKHQSSGEIRMLGVAGEDAVMDAYVSTGAFDLLITPFNVNADWRIRSRMRAARDQDMVIFARDYYPESLSTERKAATVDQPRKKGLFGWRAPKPTQGPLAGAGAFGFLHRTPNWSPEAICLAYALTDTSIASVVVQAADVERLETLAPVPERDMPPGLPAQIEMARVGTGG